LVVRSGVASVGLDGVGEYRPVRLGALAFCAVQAAAAQPVATLDVRAAALAACPVAGAAALCAFRARLPARGDEDPLRGERGERLLARLRLDAAVEGDLSWREP